MGIKLAFMFFVGFFLVEIGITGKLGSFMGAIIDPSNMSDTRPADQQIGGGSVSAGAFAFTTPGNQNYVNLAIADAKKAGINPTLFVKQINQESGFNPNAASGAGAIGIAQFIESTAAGLGINPRDPVASLAAAANLMAQYQRQYGSYAKALAAYNAGPGALQNAVALGGSNWQSYLPRETQNYISTIMGTQSA